GKSTVEACTTGGLTKPKKSCGLLPIWASRVFVPCLRCLAAIPIPRLAGLDSTRLIVSEDPTQSCSHMPFPFSLDPHLFLPFDETGARDRMRPLSCGILC